MVALDATFEALLFDWDGTAVPDRQADASQLRGRVEALCAAGVHVFVVSGTHMENVDRQLRARPAGRGRLHLCCNRGSEVFEVSAAGPALVHRRQATVGEDRALTVAAARTVAALRARGLEAAVVSQRLNRRKIDLIPVPQWADPKKADIGLLAGAVADRLAGAGIADLAEVVAIAAAEARQAGVTDPHITSDVKHIEVGLTDKADSATFAAHWLGARGITGQLVLVAGDELGPVGGLPGSDSFMLVPALARAVVVSVGVEPGGVPDGVLHHGGGPAGFLELLDRQLARRRDRRVPHIDPDPAWVVPLPHRRAQERVAETLGALTNGQAGMRAVREEAGAGGVPYLVVSGVYDAGGGLLGGPRWTGTEPARSRRAGERRWVDLRTGVLFRSDEGGEGLRSLRFVSAAAPRAMAMRAEGPAGALAPGAALRSPGGDVDFAREPRGEVDRARTRSGEAEVAVAARQWVGGSPERPVLERLAVWGTARDGIPGMDDAEAAFSEVQGAGFDALLAAHRSAWARRWAGAAVTVEGDPDSQLAARFAVFHLLGAAAGSDESAVGARGLTGEAYAGHVFWDADVFVLPALAAIWPQGARAMLEYRIRRLPAARAEAARRGLRGARFPWESAAEGTDVTPRMANGPQGQLVAIATGVREEHIVADVAWAAARYAAWTGDGAFLTGAGRDLVVDTARYWAARIRIGPDGRGHLYGVMGPDEYHQAVDDNAYTNVMARWNLRAGAELLEQTGDAQDEAGTWRRLADLLVDGWDGARGVYEQFAGYFDLDPLIMREIASPPVPADVLLGPARVARSQLIKQPDVCMLHHMVPGEVEPGSLARCLDFYEPRNAHGSSLSPAISASLLARAGQPERALALFRLASRLDLDDVTGTTAGGLHMATLGGVWQALAYGFLGLHADGGVLGVDPCLPAAWSALGLRFSFRGVALEVRAENTHVVVGCDRPLALSVGGRPPEALAPPGGVIEL
ncbi:MAG TPA: glycosyl hydrolase family 65 protein [Acidimicrobiales bacterium]|nr:glycosyl hydrolase family 65 protein [Acidimicrobiales bacterium]